MKRSLGIGCLTLLTLLTLTASDAGAQAPQIQIEVSVSERNPSVDDFVTVQVRAVSTVRGPLDLEVPSVDGLREVSRSRREGTSFSFGSGGQTMRREVALDLDFAVEKSGRIIFGPVVARAGSTEGRSQPVVLEVEGEPVPAEPEPVLPEAGLAPPGPDEQDVFLRYRVSKDRAVPGEQVTVELLLLARPELALGLEERPQIPAYDGVWMQMLDKPDPLPRTTERIDGKTYAAFRVWKVALFGLQPGEVELEAVQATLRAGRRYGRRGPRLRRSTRPRTLQIEPLPQAGRPANFPSGNVGRLKLTAEVDQKRVEAGRGLMLTLALSGTGNVPQFALPAVEVDHFKAFPPTVDTRVEADASGVQGSKTAQVLLTPTETGVLRIPPFETWAFDVATREYVKLSTEPISVRVEGEAAKLPQADAPRAEGPAPLRLRPALAQARLTPPQTRVPLGVWAALLGLPWLAVGLWRLPRGRGPAPPTPSVQALNALNRAEQQAGQGDPKAWVSAAEAFSWKLLGRPDGHAPDVRQALESASDSVRDEVEQILTQADSVRYAPELAQPPGSAASRWRGALEALP